MSEQDELESYNEERRQEAGSEEQDAREEMDDLFEKYEIVRRKVVDLTQKNTAISKDRDQLADALVVFDDAETYLCDDDDEKAEGPIKLAREIIAAREAG